MDMQHIPASVALAGIASLLVPVIVATFGFARAGGFAAKVMIDVMNNNRASEERALGDSEMPSRLAMAWHFVHIRDDLDSACGTLGVIAGLLGAIAGLLLVLTVIVSFKAFV